MDTVRDEKRGSVGTHSEIRVLKKYLKRNHVGKDVEIALKQRLRIQVDNPQADTMIAQVWGGYNAARKILKEPFSLMDCGCMCGYFYHYLSEHFKDFTYTGVDAWPEAIEVAKNAFPKARFICADFMQVPLDVHDYVVISNLPASADWYEHMGKVMSKWARIALILIYPDSEIKVIGPQAPRSILGIKKDVRPQA